MTRITRISPQPPPPHTATAAAHGRVISTHSAIAPSVNVHSRTVVGHDGTFDLETGPSVRL